MPAVPDTPDIWFQREVLPHEAALLRYLRRTWRQQDEIHDLRQEIYARVYEAAAKSRPQSAKSFLFAIVAIAPPVAANQAVAAVLILELRL